MGYKPIPVNRLGNLILTENMIPAAIWVTVVLRDITEWRNMSIHIHWIQNQWSYDTKQHSVWWQHSALGITIYALSLISSLQFGAFTELRIQWLYQEHVHFFVTFPVLLSNITKPTKPPTPTTPYIATPSNLSTPTHDTALPPAQPTPPKENEKNLWETGQYHACGWSDTCSSMKNEFNYLCYLSAMSWYHLWGPSNQKRLSKESWGLWNE